MLGIQKVSYPIGGLRFSWWVYSGFKALTLLITVLTFGCLLVTWADDWFQNRVEAAMNKKE